MMRMGNGLTGWLSKSIVKLCNMNDIENALLFSCLGGIFVYKFYMNTKHQAVGGCHYHI